MTFEMNDDLSELMDDITEDEIQAEPTEVDELLDDEVRDVLGPNGLLDGAEEILPIEVDGLPGDDRIFMDDVEYIRADAIREGFTRAIWREAARYANRTAGQPGGALRRVRDLIEEGR